MAPSPIFLSTSAFPGQAFVSPSGGSFFSSFKKNACGQDRLSEVWLTFVLLKSPVRRRERRKE
jgi:hypothetical protein